LPVITPDHPQPLLNQEGGNVKGWFHATTQREPRDAGGSRTLTT
jgi:hypothetical protein